MPTPLLTLLMPPLHHESDRRIFFKWMLSGEGSDAQDALTSANARRSHSLPSSFTSRFVALLDFPTILRAQRKKMPSHPLTRRPSPYAPSCKQTRSPPHIVAGRQVRVNLPKTLLSQRVCQAEALTSTPRPSPRHVATITVAPAIDSVPFKQCTLTKPPMLSSPSQIAKSLCAS